VNGGARQATGLLILYPVNQSNQLVVFTLDEQRYALHLVTVERVVRMVEITPLPKAPEIVPGVINVQGRIVPVVNLRRRFGLAEGEIRLSDHIILAHTLKRVVALVVDTVNGIIERSDHEVIAAQRILPGLEYVEGVTKLDEGLILIHDLGTCLSLEEGKMLDAAMNQI
jgi:purine-binding chemotaxis protein CheW